MSSKSLFILALLASSCYRPTETLPHPIPSGARSVIIAKCPAADNKPMSSIGSATIISVMGRMVLYTASHVVKCDGAEVVGIVDFGYLGSPDQKFDVSKAVFSFRGDVAFADVGPAPLERGYQTGAPPAVGDEVCYVTAYPIPAIQCGHVAAVSNKLWRTGIPAYPGNSGSGVWAKGKLIGVLSKATGCANMTGALETCGSAFEVINAVD
jgi:hypothetical protein